MDLCKGALKTGVRIAGDVLSGQNIKTAAKRRVTDAVLSGLRDPPPPGKRIKRPSANTTFTAVKRRRKKQTSKKREADIFDNGFRA